MPFDMRRMQLMVLYKQDIIKLKDGSDWGVSFNTTNRLLTL